MKKTVTIITAVLIMLAPFAIAQATSSEIHVTRDGKASVSNAKLMQIAGSTFFARLYWGDAFIRFTIKTNSKTQFFRATGEKTTIAEIKEGDLLEAVGELESGSNTLNLVATSIKNASVQKEHSVVSGNVASVDTANRLFTMYSREYGPIKVQTTASTKFTKGSRMVAFGHLRVGDSISNTSGDYNIASKTFAADSMTIYVNMNLFKPKLFIGKLAEVPAGTGATSIKVTIDNIVHTIVLNNKTLIIRENRAPAALARFVLGDTIRIWGTLREADEPVIDAEVVRNINL